MSERSERRDAERYERGKEQVARLVSETTCGIDDPKEAREGAQRAIDDYIRAQNIELEKAQKQFSLLQKVEFVIGAALILLVVFVMLNNGPYIPPVFAAAIALVVLYVVAAIIDSKAKGRREDVKFLIKAGEAAKLATTSNKGEVVVKFK